MAPDPVAQSANGPGGAANLQRILVLGAGGFIGQRVTLALAHSGWARPIAAVHHKRPALADAIETVVLDARRPEAMRSALQGVAGVVNCIAGDAQTIRASAKALFDACAGSAAPRVVNLSTMMVYGTQAGTVDEAAPLLGDWDDYSGAKADAERMALACPSVVHLRPGIVYGPQSPIWSGWIGQWLQAGRLGDLGETGQGRCNLVHVDDVVTAVLRALRASGIEGQAFNLSLPDPPSWNEYFRQYAAALDCPFASISRLQLALELFVLGPPLKALQLIGGKMRLDLQVPQPIRPWLPRLCAHAVRLDVRKAEQVLGMEWTPLERGLRAAAAWTRGGALAEPLVAAAR